MLSVIGRLLGLPISELRLYFLKFSVQHLHGPATITVGDNEAIALCVIKDGESLVKAFIDHYLQLGFKHIVFLDNGSIDSTPDIIKSHPHTTLVACSKPFSQYYVIFKNYLIQTFGQGKWCVIADVDEFLAFPGHRSLKDILEYLDRGQYNTVCIQMLDLFSRQGLPLPAQKEEPKQAPKQNWTLENLQSVFCHYDLNNLDRRRYVRRFQPKIHPAHRFLYGGIRKTVFGRSCFLTKEAMFLADHSTRLRTSHLLIRSRPADFSAVFFHYKFTEDFYTSTAKAVKAENHWRNSAEYKAYWAVLQANNQQTKLVLYQPSSYKLNKVDDLIEQAFLFVSTEFAEFLRQGDAA
ncbi:MAG: glycosyltransferase family 2 protein [Cyanobacteria bacterium J06555_13]